MTWERKNGRGRGLMWIHRCPETGQEYKLRREHMQPYEKGCPDCHEIPPDLPDFHACTRCEFVGQSKLKLLNHFAYVHLRSQASSTD